MNNLKIWFRTHKSTLTYGGRTATGSAISHDEVIRAFQKEGIECLDEWPEGDYSNAEQFVPDDPSEYLELWYGNPANWDIDVNAHRRGFAAYTRCGEAKMSQEMVDKIELCDVIFVASENAQKFHQNYLVTPVYVIFGGIETENFPYLERDFRQRPFRFLHLGVHWRKGTDVACRAFIEAFPHESDVELLVISPGETEEYNKLVERYKSEERIKFEVRCVTDRSRIAAEYYNRAHCLIYLSVIEGWGRVLAEAMATGMPCILSRESSMKEQCPVDLAWWVECIEDETSFSIPVMKHAADQMRRVYESPGLCRQRGKAVTRFANTKLTWTDGVRSSLPILSALYDAQRMWELPKNDEIKVQLACGSYHIDGWVNTEGPTEWFFRNNDKDGVYFLNMKKRFPFPDGALSAITISHAIATVFFMDSFLLFLRECHRVLKIGGTLRITDIDSNKHLYPCSLPISTLAVNDALKNAGFQIREVDAATTYYHDKSIMIGIHNHPVIFCEGEKICSSY